MQILMAVPTEPGKCRFFCGPNRARIHFSLTGASQFQGGPWALKFNVHIADKRMA
jgi:hypothetical protein